MKALGTIFLLLASPRCSDSLTCYSSETDEPGQLAACPGGPIAQACAARVKVVPVPDPRDRSKANLIFMTPFRGCVSKDSCRNPTGCDSIAAEPAEGRDVYYRSCCCAADGCNSDILGSLQVSSNIAGCPELPCGGPVAAPPVTGPPTFQFSAYDPRGAAERLAAFTTQYSSSGVWVTQVSVQSWILRYVGHGVRCEKDGTRLPARRVGAGALWRVAAGSAGGCVVRACVRAGRGRACGMAE